MAIGELGKVKSENFTKITKQIRKSTTKFMRAHLLITVFFLNALVALSISGDTTTVVYNASFRIMSFGESQMMMMYREGNGEKPSAFGYDIYFTRGKLDSVIYYEDTLRLNLLYKRFIDNKWVISLSNESKYAYPDAYTNFARIASLALPNDRPYKFTVICDVKHQAIKSIKQGVNAIGVDKYEGILVTFFSEKTRYMCIRGTSGQISPTLLFRRSGKIQKVYILDHINERTGIGEYIKLRYRFGKLK